VSDVEHLRLAYEAGYHQGVNDTLTVVLLAIMGVVWLFIAVHIWRKK